MSKIRLLVCILVGVIVLGNNTSYAQPDVVRSHLKSYQLRSGVFKGHRTGNGDYIAFKREIREPGAAWLRLNFSDLKLSARSYILITSVKDGARQRLDGPALSQWGNTSAFFNGDAIDIELHVAAQDSLVTFTIGSIVVGDRNSPSATETAGICGSQDTRQPSSNPAVGRLIKSDHSFVDNWGTAWIASTGVLVGAAHSFAWGTSGNNMVEFNVPRTLPDGTIQFSNPRDQYTIPISSSNPQVSPGSYHPGHDWAIFKVNNNSETGLQPIVAQQAFIGLEQNSNASPLIVIGYGTSSNATLNRTQQSATGPNSGPSGDTLLTYYVDAEPGNSGSPVINSVTGNAIGIHTDGGCIYSSGIPNKGMSFNDPTLWAAMHPSSHLATVDQVLSDNTKDNNLWRWNGSSFGSAITPPYPITVTPRIVRSSKRRPIPVQQSAEVQQLDLRWHFGLRCDKPA